MEVSKGTMANCNNAREGDMSPEEVAQCLTDIGQWMADHAGTLPLLPPPRPASLEQEGRTEQLPRSRNRASSANQPSRFSDGLSFATS